METLKPSQGSQSALQQPSVNEQRQLLSIFRRTWWHVHAWTAMCAQPPTVSRGEGDRQKRENEVGQTQSPAAAAILVGAGDAMASTRPHCVTVQDGELKVSGRHTARREGQHIALTKGLQLSIDDTTRCIAIVRVMLDSSCRSTRFCVAGTS